MINETKLDTWMKVYAEKLVEAIQKNPELYAYPASEAELVIHRMRGAFITGEYHKDGHAIKATCKHFGIKQTHAAIKKFLSEA